MGMTGVNMDTIRVKIKRQDSPKDLSYWESFDVPYRPSMNIIMLLMLIQENPVNTDGLRSTPVAWDYSCLEEVCGSCPMLINGRVRMSCSTLVDHLTQPIVLEPMSKFPVIRDLRVDRSRMFEALKKVNAWVTVDGYHNQGPGPRLSPEDQQRAYRFSKCIMCGCCCESCPQYNDRSAFMGAFAIGQVALLNQHPLGKMEAGKRLEAVMGPGGIADCGNAQNCEAYCPKGIPLLEAIATVGWDVTKYGIKKFFRG